MMLATLPLTLSKHLAQVVFALAAAFSVFSIGLVFVFGEAMAGVVLASVLFNIWSMIKSDRDGFVKSREMRRAFEPARHYTAVQTFTVLVLVMVQIGYATYAVLT